MDYVERDLAHIWHPASQMKDYEDFPPIIIDHAKGVKLYDVDGNEYIDIISSWWCNILGHCNDEVSSALKEQVDKLDILGHCNDEISAALKEQVDKLDHVIFANYSHKGIIELAESLNRVTPENLTKFSFVDNGSSSVESALKMAFQIMGLPLLNPLSRWHFNTASRMDGRRRRDSCASLMHITVKPSVHCL